MARTATVNVRGQQVEVEYTDHGYEPDTNAHIIDWSLVDGRWSDLTDEEEVDVYHQLLALSYEPREP